MEWLFLAAVLAVAVSPLLVPKGNPNAHHHHDFARTDEPVGSHACGSGIGYCRHHLDRCTCGRERIAGHFVEEVR